MPRGIPNPKPAPDPEVRIYYPSDKDIDSIGTSVGEITQKGLSAFDLTVGQILELESMVHTKVLRAEGPTNVFHKYSGKHRFLTAQQLSNKPYQKEDRSPGMQAGMTIGSVVPRS